MSENSLTPSSSSPAQKNRGWLHVLWIGAVLFVVTTMTMFLTSNTNLYPTVILVGNFLVPATFVTFLYDHQHKSNLTPQTIIQSFGLGGILGILGASILEAVLIPSVPHQGLSLIGALLVGLIEEGCKITIVILLARRKNHTAEIDGILLGAAVGMGFAALESTGYAFTFFLASGNHASASIMETVLRGLLAPFGHGVWTAIISAVLFRESRQARFRFNGWVILTYLFVALLLHGMWDGLPVAGLSPFATLGGLLLVCVVGILLLRLLYRQALHRQAQQALTLAQQGTMVS